MTLITAKIRKTDGKLVRVHKDGREERLKARPPRPISDDEIEKAAQSDPGNPPHDVSKMRKVARVKTLRRSLNLTQEEFSSRYRIPLGTLRDWEQGRSEPDQPARAYLAVIAGDPKGTQRALNKTMEKA
ncbi:MAG TPA: helix-turn-helix domain-containing protein [Rhizomicrobium sp.]|jgi:putative transcriptional regulator|nr:helix-turn-helix domain-containing protein [Rhizomicrobium sp.]